MGKTVISELVVLVGSDVKEALGGLDKVLVSTKRLGRSLTRTGRDLTRNITAPLAGVGIAGAKLASDLETSFAKMEGLVGVQREQLDEWEGDVRGLSQEFGISASKAADALFFITSAGLEGSDAMDALEASMKASASGLGEVSVVADLATSAMNAYGPEVLGAAEATDVLTAAVREGKLAPDELAGSMGRVIPIASAMGVRFDEVGAAMAAMSRTGTKADEAATQLRSIMTSLLKPTTTAEGALSKMGLSAAGLRAQIKDQGLLSVLQTLSEQFKGNDEAAAAVFGNVRALSGVMDLMGSNSAATADIFASLENSTGSLDGAFAAMSDTAKFRLNQAIQAGADLLIELGNAVLPPVTAALQKITAAIKPVATWFGNLDPRVKEVTVVVAGLVAGIGPLLIALGTVISVGGTLIGTVGSVAGAFAAVANPVGAAVVAIGLATAAFTTAYKESETFRTVVNKAVSKTGKVVGKVLGGVMGALTTLGEHFGEIAEEIIETLEVLLVEPFMEIWEVFGDDVLRAFRTLWETAAGILTTHFGILKALLGGALTVLSETLQLGMNVLQLDWEGAWGNVVGIFEGIKTTITGIATALWDGVLLVFQEKIKALETFLGNAVSKITAPFQKMKDAIVGNSIVPDMVEDVLEEFQRMADQMGVKTEGAEAGVLAGFIGISSTAVGEATKVVDKVAGEFGKMREKVEEKLGNVPTAVAEIFGEIAAALNLAGKGITIAETLIQWAELIGGVINTLSGLWVFIKKHGDDIKDFFGSISGGGGFQLGGPLPGGGGSPIPTTLPVINLPSGDEGEIDMTIFEGILALHDQSVTHLKEIAGAVTGAGSGAIPRLLEGLRAQVAISGNQIRLPLENGTNRLLRLIRDHTVVIADAAWHWKQMNVGQRGMTGGQMAGAQMAAVGGGGTSVQVHFHGPVSTTSEAELSALLRRELTEHIDESLGDRERIVRSASGELS